VVFLRNNSAKEHLSKTGQRRRAPKSRTLAQIASKEASIGNRLPYGRHVDDHTIETRDGMLMQVIRIEGFPFETADTEDLNYRKAIRETMLRAIAHPRFALVHHIVRMPVTAELPPSYLSKGFASDLDRQWRGRIEGKALYANQLFLTIVRRPLQGRSGLLDSALDLFRRSGAEADAAQKARDLRELNTARDTILASLSAYGARVLSVYDTPKGPCSEPLEFLSLLLNDELRPVLLPQSDLGHHLPYRRISFGLEAVELHKAAALPRQFAAILSIKDYPPHTAPGLLDSLMRLPLPMTVTETFAFVDRQVALDRMNLALRRMRAADDDAISLRRDLSEAKDDVSAGRSAFGEHHLTVMVKADSLAGLDEACADIQATFTEEGLIAVREDVNLEPAFWAQFPGNFKDIARRALVSTGNFASLASFHNFPLGQASGNHWGDAVTVLETTSATPYAFNFHKADLGNFTIIGPSGSGKTVVLNFLLAQALKFQPRLVLFDKDRGSEIFIRAIGGTYEALRFGEPTGMNPLALPDTLANRAFVADWLARLVSLEGQALTPEETAMIADAVDANFDQEPQLRRLRHVAELFAGIRRPTPGDLASRLEPWINNGPHAWLFDNDVDRLNLNQPIVGIDMTSILDAPTLRTPVMMYLFHCVEQRLDGNPAMIVVDEGWKALDDAVFVARIRDWEKTIRKRNGIVGFATQSASDALDSQIASAIIEQAATQIFMPNPKAQADEYKVGFGLSDHELDLVRALPDSSRCFLIKHGNDSVVARLNLDGMAGALVVLSGRESSVRKLDTLRAKHGDDPAVWLPMLTGVAP
jgi:type IV secretion system protein VirB4